MIGRKLQERFEIVRSIGHGGMGTVYEARSLSGQERVAIKWMHARPFAAGDPDLLRFVQEARIVGALESPHVPRLIELAQDPDVQVPYQVMELLAGEDLGALLDRVGALRPDVALRIAAQACKGLAVAHAAGVVHRDVKPQNLFLARKEEGGLLVKVLDFGVAKIRRAPAGAPKGLTAPSSSMTDSGQVVGTPLYMAPEQLEGAKHVDARSDVYSMGVTLYALLAGKPPHADAKSLLELLNRLVSGPPPPLVDAAPWVPPAIRTVVERAMAASKEARYRDAGALLEALEPLLPEGADLTEEMLVPVDEATKGEALARQGQALDAGGGGAAAGLHTPEERRRSPGRGVAVAVLIMAVVVGLCWVLLRR
ncbi:serine/threonine-protein kinase [Polyangium mundeleinium]|uniref:Serine/threonine-protein kinase n=1 Tax=Polyangium mundeleinium TaxID=2995306 RepID=A0ABT5EUH3_9BACT|nr:serine/threonine-protein kinase [Polyangium mundeleinium]MDC0745470.1 serine/threonine-protein kinase [Polyangium mundeleinium]